MMDLVMRTCFVGSGIGGFIGMVIVTETNSQEIAFQEFCTVKRGQRVIR